VRPENINTFIFAALNDGYFLYFITGQLKVGISAMLSRLTGISAVAVLGLSIVYSTSGQSAVIGMSYVGPTGAGGIASFSTTYNTALDDGLTFVGMTVTCAIVNPYGTWNFSGPPAWIMVNALNEIECGQTVHNNAQAGTYQISGNHRGYLVEGGYQEAPTSDSEVVP
jgi:hypothetical protein